MFEAVVRLSSECAAVGVRRAVVGLADDHSEADRERWGDAEVQVSPVVGPRRFGYAPAMAGNLAGVNPDLVHLHGLWMYPSIVCERWGARTNRPYVVSPHGMLEGWALRNRALPKRVASFLYERRMLDGSAVIHALNRKEAEDIRAFGIRRPIAVIPNGVDPAVPVGVERAAWVAKLADGRRILVYLGRLHPKKNLASLVAGWAKADRERDISAGWRLVIAGWDQDSHQAYLEGLCEREGVRGSVVFAGPRFGIEKAELLAAADAFVLPSLSEGQPIALLEAMSYGLPALATTHCNLPEAMAAEAVKEIGIEAESIGVGIAALTEMSEGQLAAMGLRGRKLVEGQFSWTRTARQMAEVYAWVTGRGGRPEVVFDA